MIRNLCHEAVYRLLSDHCTGGVVGVGYEDRARLRRDRRKHGVEIGRVARIGHLDCIGSEELSHQLVNCKGMTRHHDLVAGTKEGMAYELDDLVRPVAENDILTGHAESFRYGTAQFVPAAIRIEMGAL